MSSVPFFSIITVTKNDAWSLIRTARSVFEQDFDDFEYIIVDGASKDGTQNLVSFWEAQGLVNSSMSEPDSGVYSAMNKGLKLARGQFVCFLNSNDVFASSEVLTYVNDLLRTHAIDGLLGWGELNGQIWASWAESEAFKMASLGFCHQALFVRRDLLVGLPFDERPFKTDSDTLQLSRLYAGGASISILPDVLALRGADAGISANLNRSEISILNTLTEEYPGLSSEEAKCILSFRRNCWEPDRIIDLFSRVSDATRFHLAYLLLDTLFQRQSSKIDDALCEMIFDLSLSTLSAVGSGGETVQRLIVAQSRRAQLMADRKNAQQELDRTISKFEADEEKRIVKFKSSAIGSDGRDYIDFIVSLTSFPARLKTVSFAISSLFEQTQPPKEIHLWLGRDEIAGRNWLPSRLLALEERGLVIHFADRTCHQYDKFLHNSELNAELPFIIVDDDVIYPPQSLEHLLSAHQHYPNAVIGNRCHKIEFDENGNFSAYRTWKREVRLSTPSFGLMPTGAGGVLYPPGFLSDPMVSRIDDILSNAPYADDIWLKVCSLARAIPTFATPLSHKSDWYHRYTPTMQAGTLMATNVERGLNDVQIARCLIWLDRIRPGWRDELFSVGAPL